MTGVRTQPITQDGYGLVNAGVIWQLDDAWSLSLQGSNLADEEFLTTGYVIPALGVRTGFYGNPRQYSPDGALRLLSREPRDDRRRHGGGRSPPFCVCRRVFAGRGLRISCPHECTGNRSVLSIGLVVVARRWRGSACCSARRCTASATRAVFAAHWRHVYALSLAVHCTSWTFYGTVTQAARYGWPLPPTFVGAILLYAARRRPSCCGW